MGGAKEARSAWNIRLEVNALHQKCTISHISCLRRNKHVKRMSLVGTTNIPFPLTQSSQRVPGWVELVAGWQG